MKPARYLFGSGVSSGWHNVIADVLNCRKQVNYTGITIMFYYITERLENHKLHYKYNKGTARSSYKA